MVAILDGLRHNCGEFGPVELPAIRTLLDLCLMLGHFDLDGRYLEHLTLLEALRLRLGQWGVAGLAFFHWMLLGVIRLRDRFQRMALMTGLSAALLPATLPETARSGFL